MNYSGRAHLALFITALIWTANYWITKWMIPIHLKPEQLVILRIGGALPLFWIVSFFIPDNTVSKKNLIYLAITALFGISLNQVFFIEGINLTSPVDVSVIHVSNPVFVLLLAAFFLNEKVTWLKTTGILLGAAGAILIIISGKNVDLHSGNWVGNILAVLNTVAYAVYLVMIKPVMKLHHPITAMKWLFLFGFLITLPYSARSLSEVDVSAFSSLTWLALGFIILFPTFIAYFLTIYSLKHVTAATVSYYSYTQPIFVALVAWFLSIDVFTPVKILGTVLIFGGVYLVGKKNGFNFGFFR